MLAWATWSLHKHTQKPKSQTNKPKKKKSQNPEDQSSWGDKFYFQEVAQPRELSYICVISTCIRDHPTCLIYNTISPL